MKKNNFLFLIVVFLSWSTSSQEIICGNEYYDDSKLTTLLIDRSTNKSNSEDYDCITATFIPIAYHVVRARSEDVPLSTLRKLTEIINNAFSGTGIYFYFYKKDVIDNRYFANNALFDESARLQMQNLLSLKSPFILDFYIVGRLPFGSPVVGGIGSFPWDYSNGDYRHGVILSITTLLELIYGSPDVQKTDNGDLAVHEIGHFLGLHHTFKNGCNGEGDFVDDTPAHPGPTGFDNCSDIDCDGNPLSNNSLRNFMNYIGENCMDRFTSGQTERMCHMIQDYRPELKLVPENIEVTQPVSGIRVFGTEQSIDVSDGFSIEGNSEVIFVSSEKVTFRNAKLRGTRSVIIPTLLSNNSQITALRSNSSTANFNDVNYDITIVPNPANKKASIIFNDQIKTDFKAQSVNIHITDNLGNILDTYTHNNLNNSFSVNVSQYIPGFYNIICSIGETKIKTKKLVIK